MSLIRWFRRNKKRMMVTVVVVIMFGFVGGSYLQKLARRDSGGDPGEVIAYSGDIKITRKDMILANQEMEVLSVLGAEQLLKSIRLPMTSSYDLRPLILCQILFGQQKDSPDLDRFIKQTVRTNRYAISESQINEISAAPLPGHVYWLLLNTETEQAGLQFEDNYVGKTLGNVIPKITGAGYSEVISQVVSRYGVSEDRILEVFGKLLAVLEYAKSSCSNQSLTLPQLRVDVSLRGQTIDAELVGFKSDIFAKEAAEPTEQQLSEQFEKYKKYYPESISEQNPYGFGYKLPEMAVVEYIAVKLEDVAAVIEPPTHQQAEDYYQRYAERFIRQVPSDPQDPNSPPIEQRISYAEVADIIIEQLGQERTNSKAEKILSQAREIVEKPFEELEKDPLQLSSQELAALSGDYVSTAQQLSDDYGIKVYAGRTGLLSAVDMQVDETISTLYLTGLGYNPIRLTKVIFAVDELGTSQLGPFDFPKPKMYQNIGPARDAIGQIMTLVRIVEADKGGEPNSIDYSFSKKTFDLGQESEEAVYSAKEFVTEDLKRLAVLDTTRKKAEQFLSQVEKLGWDEALEEVNKRYSLQDTDSFRIEKLTGFSRRSAEDLRTAAVMNAASPEARFMVNQDKKQQNLAEHLYGLVAADANTIEGLPIVTELKANMSFLCIKDIKVRRVELSEYQRIKPVLAYNTDSINSQMLTPVHFNPDNIVKRMNFRWLDEKEN